MAAAKGGWEASVDKFVNGIPTPVLMGATMISGMLALQERDGIINKYSAITAQLAFLLYHKHLQDTSTSKQ